MPTLSFKIAFPIIAAGFFIMVTFIALNYQNLNASFYIIFLLMVIYIFLFGVAIGQKFTQPVRKLLKRADELSRGDLKSRFYSESKDEIGQLSNVFNKIAEQLEESNTESERTKMSVGIKVEAETQGLKEIISALEQKVQNRTMELEKAIKDSQRYQQQATDAGAQIAELKSQLAQITEKPVKSGGKKTKEVT